MKSLNIQLTALLLIELLITLPFYIVEAVTISNVLVNSAGTSANISWTTNVEANGTVKYGKGGVPNITAEDSSLVINHSFTLAPLEPDTNYNYQIISASNESPKTTASGSFWTRDITPPNIVTGLKNITSTLYFVDLAWDRNPATDLLLYTIYRDDAPWINTTTNSYKDTDVNDDITYIYRVSATDRSYNEGPRSAPLSVKTPLADKIPPTMSSAQIISSTTSSFTLAWSTDESSTAIIYYGTSSAILDSVATGEGTGEGFQFNYTVAVSNLQNGTTYFFIPGSCDASNNCINGSLQSITVGSDLEPPFINVSLPSFYNQKEIDLVGKVEPKSIVRLYVDGELKRQLSALDTQNGNLRFFKVALGAEGGHTLRLTAKDLVGNLNEKGFSIIVDTQKPRFILDELPNILTNASLNVSGRVDEPVAIQIFVRFGQEDKTPPPKISNLASPSSDQNSVTLTWDAVTEADFAYYIIYRDSIPIAVTTPIDYNTYQDVLVNSGMSYTYHVSAIDKNANEGIKSEPLTVTMPATTSATTPARGISNIPAPQPVNLSSLIQQAQVTIGINQSSITATGGIFSRALSLDQGDGAYEIKFQATDMAGNTVLIDKSILVDTKPPEIEIVDPREGTFIYETTANEITIKGKTEPFAEVHLFVERTPLGSMNVTFDVSSMPVVAFKDIAEDKLRASCRVKVGGSVLCKTGADYSVTADENGLFEFKKVDLRSGFASGLRITQTEVGKEGYTPPAADSTQVRLFFIATDAVGQRGISLINYRMGTCWSGNFSWAVAPLHQYQSPTFLSVERIAEGTEYVYFFLNISYIGRGSASLADIRPVIQSFNIQKACDEVIAQNPKYSVSCDILQSCTSKSNEDKTLQYVACPLKRYNKFNEIGADEWKEFFEALGNEMVFPFKVRVGYGITTYEGKRTTEFQTLCMPITYSLDNSKVNFKKVLPDWLLFDAVDWLNSSIKTLDDVLVELRRVLEYVGIGCVASFGIKFVLTVFRRFTCYWEGYQDTVKQVFEQKEEKQPGEKPCPRAESAQARLSNAELERDCEACASAWESEESIYKLYRGLCDRVFCHSSPAAWTADPEVQDEDLRNRVIQEAQTCGNEDDVMGQRMMERPCSSYDEKFLERGIIEKNSAGNNCYLAFVRENGNKGTLLFVRSNEDADNANKIFKFEAVSKISPTIGTYHDLYAREVNGRYMTGRVETCEELCQNRGYEAYGCGFSQSCSDLNYDYQEGEPEQLKQQAWSDLSVRATAKGRTGASPFSEQYNKGTKYTASRLGYTYDCIFGHRSVPNAAELPPAERDTDLKKTTECCCINSAGSTGTGPYYKDTDVSRASYESESGLEIPAHKTDEESGQLRWNYRYWKIKYEALDKDNKNVVHKQYNPYRYYKDRDSMACFGQREVFLAGEDKVMHDPFKSHVSAFQCLCISGIYNRLTLIKNIMVALRNCLITVRETGSGDTGACKELFSQYVCSLIWQIISYFRHRCTPFSPGLSEEAQINDVEAVLEGGLDAVFGGVAETQNEIAEEYGNAQLNNLLGGSEEAIARKACLAAFGYDWEISLDNVLDAAYSTPFATLVQAVNARREYLTFDPFDGTASYDYRASWLINPGCNFDDYDVYLSCVSLKEMENHKDIRCQDVHDPEGSDCDCLNLREEQALLFHDGRGLQQNALEDRDKHEVIKQNYRFDHLKFVLRPQIFIRGRTPTSYTPNTQRCFPEGHGDGVFYFPLRDATGYDIPSCYVDAATSQFRCLSGEAFFGTKGQAYFVSEKINNLDLTRPIEIGVGEALEVTPTIFKSTGPDVCLEASLWNPVDREPEQVKYFPVNIDGRSEYPPIQVSPRLELRSSGIFQFDRAKMEAQLIGSQENLKTVDIALSFTSQDETYFISPQSDDTLEITNRLPKRKLQDLKNYQTQELNITVEEGRITIQILRPQQERVKFVITRVDLTHVRDANQWIHRDTARISPVVSQRETKTLRLKLLRLKGEAKSFSDPNECNPDDIVSYQGEPQLKEHKIAVSSAKPVIRDLCTKQGYTEETQDCICGQTQPQAIGQTAGEQTGGQTAGQTEEQQTVETARRKYQKNCGPGYEGKYCYMLQNAAEESCQTVPRCHTDRVNQVSCDCNLDGKVTDSVTSVNNEQVYGDCDVRNSKYCYADENGAYGCHPGENPKADTTPPIINNFAINNRLEKVIKIAQRDQIRIGASILDKESGIKDIILNVEKAGEEKQTKPQSGQLSKEEIPYRETYQFTDAADYRVWIEVTNGNGLSAQSEKWVVEVSPKTP